MSYGRISHPSELVKIDDEIEVMISMHCRSVRTSMSDVRNLPKLLRFPKWRIALYDLASGQITVLPGQDGLNLNPQWAPDEIGRAHV